MSRWNNPNCGFQKGHGGNFGKKLSLETRRKMSETHKKIGTGKWMLGRKLPQETINKMRASAKRGEDKLNWMGDNVGKVALHDWVKLYLGFPKKCEHCGVTEARFEWANKSHLYKRDLTDWIRLCTSCHRKYDKTERNLPWFKEKMERGIEIND